MSASEIRRIQESMAVREKGVELINGAERERLLESAVSDKTTTRVRKRVSASARRHFQKSVAFREKRAELINRRERERVCSL